MSNLVTGKVRFSYAHVFEPYVTPNGDEKYSVTLLIPKSDTNTYQRIMEAINNTLQESVATTFKGVMPANPRLPIYDGDGLRDSGEPFGAECKGCWVMHAKSNSAPEVVDAQCIPIINKNELYSGCYGRASLQFYAYSHNGNKGIGCGLGNVQKLEDGQPLGGRTTIEEDFGTPIAQAPMQQYQAPTQATYPQAPMQQYQAPTQATYPQAPMQQYQAPTQPIAPTYIGQVDPITGNPLNMQPTVNNIYGVN